MIKSRTPIAKPIRPLSKRQKSWTLEQRHLLNQQELAKIEETSVPNFPRVPAPKVSIPQRFSRLPVDVQNNITYLINQQKLKDKKNERNLASFICGTLFFVIGILMLYFSTLDAFKIKLIGEHSNSDNNYRYLTADFMLVSFITYILPIFIAFGFIYLGVYGIFPEFNLVGKEVMRKWCYCEHITRRICYKRLDNEGNTGNGSEVSLV